MTNDHIGGCRSTPLCGPTPERPQKNRKVHICTTKPHIHSRAGPLRFASRIRAYFLFVVSRLSFLLGVSHSEQGLSFYSDTNERLTPRAQRNHKNKKTLRGALRRGANIRRNAKLFISACKVNIVEILTQLRNGNQRKARASEHRHEHLKPGTDTRANDGIIIITRIYEHAKYIYKEL